MPSIVEVPADGLDYIIYGKNSVDSTRNYVQKQFELLAPYFEGIPRSIYDSIKNAYDYVTNKLNSLSVLSKLNESNLSIENMIGEYLSFEEIAKAPINAQPWIMAHPELKRLYVEQRIQGYPDTYYNVDKSYGESDPYYRKVMDGILVSVDDDTFKINYYLDTPQENEVELNTVEQFNILNTWDVISWLLKNTKFDFTDPNMKSKRREG